MISALHSAAKIRARAIVVIATLMIAAQVVTACSAGAPGSSGPSTSETVWERSKRDKTITWGVANEPPYTIWPSGSDLVSGQGPDTIKAVMALYGIDTFKAVREEFSGLIPGLLAERFDVIANGHTITPPRCEQIAFTNPFLVGLQALAVRAGNPLNLHSIKDIAANPNAKVGALQGSIEVTYLVDGGVAESQIFQFPDNTTVLAALDTGRIDAVEAESAPLLYELARLKNPNLENALPFQGPVDAAGNPIVNYAGVGMRKEDTDMIDDFNKGLAQLRSSGAWLSAIEPYGFTEGNIPPPDVTAEQRCAGG
jgi:polar amino acid transport system substrate-binding protein